MIIGITTTLEYFQKLPKSQGLTIKRCGNVWFVHDQPPGDDELAIAAKLEATQQIDPAWIPHRLDINRYPFRPVINGSNRTASAPRPFAAKGSPPIKMRPGILAKVISFWKVTNGPRTDNTIFQTRLDTCLKRGGFTWSPVAGEVKEVGEDYVLIDATRVHVPADEKPIVKEKDIVAAGQPLTTGRTPDVQKRCPYVLDGTYQDKPAHWCDACGCGNRSAARLEDKLYWVRISCPRTPPLFDAEKET